MEIFNNIWLYLCTSNEQLTNIIVALSCYIETFLIVNLFLTIFSISSNKRQTITYIILISTINIFYFYLVASPFNILLNYITMIVLLPIFFKGSFVKNTISIVISSLIFNVIGILILNPYIIIFNITPEDLLSIPIYRTFYMILIYCIIFIIYLIIKRLTIKIDLIEKIDSKTKTVIITNFILGTLTIIVQSIIMFYYINKLPILLYFCNFIFSLAYLGISIYCVSRIFKLISTTQKLESAESYNNTLHILHDNVRAFQHDFDNIVTTIGGYIRTDDMDGLKNYYFELEDDCQKVNNLYILNPDIINNNGIYNLLTKKYHEADLNNIKVNITFLLNLSELNMKIYEFARILGILLDNAIEACTECDEKVINIIFRNDNRNRRHLVIIENTYNNKDIDTSKIFEKGFSGKENHTGLGLWEVRKIIKKNNNINLFTSKNEKFFSQQLEIYY